MATLFERLRQALAPDYEVERELASGGMGSVFLAYDRKLDRRIALKILRPELASATASERFVREARTLARLKHPCIVPVYQAAEWDGLSYYLMEYVEGETLAERLTKGPLTSDSVAKLADDLLAGLEVAHANGIVHRDVKPANVILVGERAVLVDFGIAKRVRESDEQLTASGHVVGTPAYMAPEQLAGDEATPATDIYAVGMLLYEAVTGRRWARSSTDMADWGGVPGWLYRGLRRALALSPEERWQSAADFRRAVTLATGHTPLMSLVWRGTVVATLALAAVLTVKYIASEADTGLLRERVAVAIFENQTGDPTLEPLGKIAALSITDGLVEMGLATGLVKVVPTIVVIYESRSSDGLANSSGTLSVAGLADRTRAGTIVSGAYFLHGDTLRFQAEVIDAATSDILQTLSAAVSSVSDPMQAVNELRDRIQAALATIFDLRIGGTAEVSSQPPTFEAYQEYVTAVQLIVEDKYKDAIPHLYKAYSADSTYTMPLLWLAAAVDEGAEKDSLVRIVAALDEVRLRPYDRMFRDVLLSFANDEPEPVRLQAVERLLDLAPDPLFVALVATFEGVFRDRPRWALHLISLLDPELNYARGWTAAAAAESYHMLGRHRDELEEARAVRSYYRHQPDALKLEVQALAALGRGDEVWASIDEAIHLGSEEQRAAEDLIEVAAGELYAHGHREIALEVLGRAIEWYETRPEITDTTGYSYSDAFFGTPEVGQIVAVRRKYGTVLYMAGRLDEAEAVFDIIEIPPRSEDEFECSLNRARIAARRGNRAAAMRLSACLWDTDKKLFMIDRVYQEAVLLAILGEKDEAVRLLRIRAAGFWGSQHMGRHRDFNLLPLRGYQPFEELIAPRG
jgi:serine/threonine-protein kinase